MEFTGSYLGKSDTESLTVSHGLPVRIAVTGSNSSVPGGSLVNFMATAYDAYNNTWDVTSMASWSASSGAEGSWANNTYTSNNIGNWTIAAYYSGVQGTVQLTVYDPIDFYDNGVINFNNVIYFVNAYISYYEYGTLNSACDLNHDGTLNFLDIELFVQYYVTYASV